MDNNLELHRLEQEVALYVINRFAALPRHPSARAD
jgi:hypothetical protein